MRIAQIAPLVEAVPPKRYGGTERVVSYLTEELVRAGHEVTLFASGDSRTSAELVACSPVALRQRSNEERLPYVLRMLDEVWRRRADWDVLHFHGEVLHFPRFRDMAASTITTLHSRLDQFHLQRICQGFPEFPLVSISNAQRGPMPRVNWMGTVYHGLPPGLLRLADAPRRPYLAFLGRVSPEKRLDRAIEIARRARIPLKAACKVDPADRAYFERLIRPLLAGPMIELVGEIGDQQKPAFLCNACALLFPIDWPEPFGLVMIEAMACGTPVIAFREGAVTEVVDEGVTGFIVENIDEAVSAIARLPEIRRAGVRRRFEQRFCAARMACDYVSLYRKLLRPSIQLERAAAGSGTTRARFQRAPQVKQ